MSFANNSVLSASLDLSYSNRISDEDFYNFLERLPINRITHINLDNVSSLEDRCILLLISKQSQTLEVLNIDGENNSDSAFLEISKCYKLHSLTVNFAQSLTDASLRSLPTQQKFREICFRKGHGFSDEGLLALLSRCCFADLTTLNLSECGNFSNSCAVLIGANCRNLTHLSLCWCWEVDDTGILPIVTRCYKMIEMDLTGKLFSEVLSALGGYVFTTTKKSAAKAEVLIFWRLNIFVHHTE